MKDEEDKRQCHKESKAGGAEYQCGKNRVSSVCVTKPTTILARKTKQN